MGTGGPLLIHFDGWSRDYDYWAELDSLDLHPVGFCEQRGRELQKPNSQCKTVQSL
jgi:hypothetical protein